MDGFPAFSEAKKANNMDKEGRVFRMFVPQKEVEATQEFLSGTDVTLSDFYKRAFEEGKKVVLQDLCGNETYLQDGISGDMYLLKNTNLGLDVESDAEEVQDNSGITSLTEFKLRKKI